MSLVLDGTYGITVPDPAAAPAFSAYQSTAQSALSASTWTKIVFQTKEFDTNNNFDNTTNYRFTPTIAGYYQVNSAVYFSATAAFLGASIYKNGSMFKQGQWSGSASAGNSIVSSLVYLNGTTDYIEIYGYTGTSQVTVAGSTYTYFQAAFVRSA